MKSVLDYILYSIFILLLKHNQDVSSENHGVYNFHFSLKMAPDGQAETRS